MTEAFASPHVVAYDLVSGAVVLVGTDARYMLAFMSDHMWPQVDLGLIEVVDVGPSSIAQRGTTVSLAEARARGRTLYRGVGVGDLPPVSLPSAAEPGRVGTVRDGVGAAAVGHHAGDPGQGRS